jgi:hypothetical protein
MSPPSNLPESYKHVLLRDRPAPQFADDHLSPRSRLVGHPLAPFLTVPQLPTADHGMGSPLEPAPGVGLEAPMVLVARQPSYDLGWAADLSARTIDFYLLTCQYSTAPLELTNFWLHGVFLPDSPHSSHMPPFCLLDRSRLAPRKSPRPNRPTGSREKYNQSGTRPSHSMDGLRYSNPTSCHASSVRSLPPSYPTLDGLPGGTHGHSYFLLSGRSIIPARFTPA